MNYTFSHTGDFEMKATTFFGLEEVLAAELRKLGAKDVEPFKRGVSCVGDLGFLYKANLCSVSYTHLDVYKRQVLLMLLKK